MKQPLLKRLAAEPFAHFVALGALIFLAFHWFGAGGADLRIELGEQDLQQLRAQSQKQWGKAPSEQEMEALVQQRVREEVLVREALAQGLDKDDIVVRRRLAQKMEFLNHAELAAPSDAELHAFYEAHAKRYTSPALADVEQLQFDDLPQAQAALQALNQGRPVRAGAAVLPSRFYQVDALALARDFGDAFADEVFKLQPGIWSAPLPSVHGLHLVRVSQRRAAQRVDFGRVQERVRSDWADAQATAQRDAAYAALRRKYTVVLSGQGDTLQLSALANGVKAAR